MDSDSRPAAPGRWLIRIASVLFIVNHLFVLPLAPGVSILQFMILGIPGVFYSNNLDAAEGLRHLGICVLALVLGAVPMLCCRTCTPAHIIAIHILPIMLYIYGAHKNLKTKRNQV